MNCPAPRSVALKVLALTMIACLFMGCATMRYGGAPEPSSNINDDIKELSLHFEGSNSITKYYQNPGNKARDEFIVGRLTLMNLRYLKFIHNLTSERQLLDAATAITVMGLGLAGPLVPLGLTTKILATVSAGITGTKEAIDKNYYFQKTIPALVAQMNAERQKALTPILQGMQKDFEHYRLEQAVVDLNNYYQAGTFTGAIQAIQVEASKVEEKQKERNFILSMPTQEEQEATKKIKEFFDKILAQYGINGQIQQIENLRITLKNLKVDVPAEDKEVFARLNKVWQDHNWQQRTISSVDILKALQDAKCSF